MDYRPPIPAATFNRGRLDGTMTVCEQQLDVAPTVTGKGNVAPQRGRVTIAAFKYWEERGPIEIAGSSHERGLAAGIRADGQRLAGFGDNGASSQSRANATWSAIRPLQTNIRERIYRNEDRSCPPAAPATSQPGASMPTMSAPANWQGVHTVPERAELARHLAGGRAVPAAGGTMERVPWTRARGICSSRRHAR